VKIRRIYLGDFGLFQNEKIEEIADGLVVIGGPNRAGKTTFMTALRHLGYGLPDSRLLPPAAAQYEIRADIEHNGHHYTLQLQGHGSPRVYPVDGAPELTIQELFNHLDRFTYHQLFTISLDELRQLPEGLSTGEEQKLAAVLLGAGWRDSLRLAQLRDHFNAEADRIGGKHGRPEVRQFKPYFENLQKGLEKRAEARAQQEKYYNKKRELGKLESVIIPKYKQDLAEAEEELLCLELLGEHHERFKEFKTLKADLEQPQNQKLLATYRDGWLHEAERVKEDYDKALEKFQAAVDNFVAQTGNSPTGALPGKLLEAEETLDSYRIDVAGLREQVKTVRGTGNELHEEMQNLISETGGLYEDWADDVSVLETLKVDKVNEQQLQREVQDYTYIINELHQKEEDLADVKAVLEKKGQERDEIGPAETGFMRRIWWAVAADMVLVLLTALMFPVSVAVTIGAVGGVGVLVYFLWASNGVQEHQQRYAALCSEFEELQGKKETLLKRVRKLKDQLEKVKQKLVLLKKDCNIPVAIEVEFLPGFVQQVRSLKQRYQQWTRRQQALERKKQELQSKLSSLMGTLHHLGLETKDYEDLVAHAEDVFAGAEKAAAYLDLAREMKAALEAKETVENRITDLLKQEDPSMPEASTESPQEVKMALESFTERGRTYEALKQKQNNYNTLYQSLKVALDTERLRRVLLARTPVLPTDEDAVLSAFGYLWAQFPSEKALQAKYQDVQKEVDQLRTALEYAEEQRRNLKGEVEELGSDEKLLQSQAQIDSARSEMEPLVENYAVFRIAALILDQAHKKLMERTRNLLLSPASQIFKGITRGDYQDIQPPGDGNSTAFTAILSGGKKQDLSSLSRATREQLFLAVRLSRIREIKPELPVILDDTFANFDPLHTQEAGRFLSELAKTHQVFVLTCHPELIECLQDCSTTAQFWSLEQGRFSGPYTDGKQVAGLLREVRK